jgi:hypothetical protein
MSKGTSSIRSCTKLVGVFIVPLCRLTLSRHRLHPENPAFPAENATEPVQIFRELTVNVADSEIFAKKISFPAGFGCSLQLA